MACMPMLTFASSSEHQLPVAVGHHIPVASRPSVTVAAMESTQSVADMVHHTHFGTSFTLYILT